MSADIKRFLLLFARGLAMGAADVVPGVSGGTIAFITGIYQELIDSLRAIGPQTLVTLYRRGVAAAWQEINGSFLVAVFLGVAVSLFSLASVIELALSSYPIMVWSFFWGLIVASIWHLAKQITPVRWPLLLWFGLGALVALLISIARPTELPGHWWVMMLGGSVAICAMILPGISGSFILLLLGLYTVFIQALSDINLVLLLSFAVGAGCGLLLFARFLSWLLASFYQATLAVLTGFLLGSLNVIWPWKQVIETRLDRHGELIPVVQKNLAPWQYEALVGQTSQWVPAILFALLGFALVLMLEFVSKPALNEQSK